MSAVRLLYDGTDSQALQPEYELIAPPNSFFSVVDVTQGLPFPDKSCTLVYSRWMMAGVSLELRHILTIDP